MVRAFLPGMKKRNEGHIVATSSVAAFTCAANIVPYAATKYGVTGKKLNNKYFFSSFQGEENKIIKDNLILVLTIRR